MKKILLTMFLMITMLLPLSNLNAQSSPMALTVQGGYSWLNGVVGGELQIGHIGLSGGWMPTTMPISGDNISSYGFAGTYYTGYYNELSSYLSVGIASQGYRYEYYGSYGNGENTAPMTIIMLGEKYGTDTFNVKLGFGYGWCDQGDAFTFEATLGFVLFKNITDK